MRARLTWKPTVVRIGGSHCRRLRETVQTAVQQRRRNHAALGQLRSSKAHRRVCTVLGPMVDPDTSRGTHLWRCVRTQSSSKETPSSTIQVRLATETNRRTSVTCGSALCVTRPTIVEEVNCGSCHTTHCAEHTVSFCSLLVLRPSVVHYL